MCADRLRIIVAGSSGATKKDHGQIVLEEFIAAWESFSGPDFFEKPGVLVVRKDARGVDRIAATIAADLGWEVERRQARWRLCETTIPETMGGCPPGKDHIRSTHGTAWCPFAGLRRNQAMIDLGADLLLAFPARYTLVDSLSRRCGTLDCVARAAAAGIPMQMLGLDVRSDG